MLTILLLAVLAQGPVPDILPEGAPDAGTPAVVPPLPIATLPPATHELFERLKGRVVQVRIIERRSGTKSSIGSAFFVKARTRRRCRSGWWMWTWCTTWPSSSRTRR